MKKNLVMGIAAAAFCGTPAFAADMAAKVLPPTSVAAPYSWTGCYVGGNIGGGWGQKTLIDPPTGLIEDNQSPAGVVGGGQIGCDVQFAGSWVIGFQGMLDASGMKNGAVPELPFFPGFADSGSIPWLATLTGRLGYTVTPSVLLYAKGGAAWIRDENTSFAPPNGSVFSGFGDVTRGGWTAGGGLEWMFAPNWSAFFEWNYMSFDTNRTTVFTPPGGAMFTGFITENVQIALVGINFRFGGH
jgi:outer membrane immunogenic protein